MKCRREHPLKSRVKRAVFYFAKYAGLFHLSRFLTRKGLRILCYHGGAVEDEHHFSPGTFMSHETFSRRMALLQRQKYPVLTLDDAIARLDQGSLPSGSTVITIDDGWYGTYSIMRPVLKAAKFPATLYVSTYYVEKQTQVFNMFVRYLLWRYPEKEIDLSRLGIASHGNRADGASLTEAKIDRIFSFAEEKLDYAGRQALAERLAEEFGYDLDSMQHKHMFRFVDVDEIRTLASDGIDIQLHTHRHRMLTGSRKEVENEISENATFLEQILDKQFNHFCYPSGNYGDAYKWLGDLGIRTATTALKGFNYPDTPRLLLRRIVDSDVLTEIEFEAELCGFVELMRAVRLA